MSRTLIFPSLTQYTYELSSYIGFHCVLFLRSLTITSKQENIKSHKLTDTEILSVRAVF